MPVKPDRSLSDTYVMTTPGQATVVIPPGHVVSFEAIGGGGAGGNWDGARGRSALRVTGTLPAVGTDRQLVIHCGGGGAVDPDVSGGGPALGGAGGVGYVPGGAGGWGTNWSAGGGGGGGGAPENEQSDAAQPGDDGQAGLPPDISEEPGASGMKHLREEHSREIRDGTPGRSRRRLAGGGGGGGGGGWHSGSGGTGGAGGAAGGSGGTGAFIATGAVLAIASTADAIDPVRAPTAHSTTPGAGGLPGRALGTGGAEGAAGGEDGRVACRGEDGSVRLTWAPPGFLADRLLQEQRIASSDGRPLAERDAPVPAVPVVMSTSGPRRRLDVATIPKTVELVGAAPELWDALDGSTTVGQIVAQESSSTRRPELLDAITHAVGVLREDGFIDPPAKGTDPDAPADAPFGYGYDLVGNRYRLRADPAGRPSSKDLLCAAYPIGSAPHAGLVRLVDGLRDRLGRDKVIWALKHVDGRIRFEFYLFANAGSDHPLGLPGLFADTVAVLEDLAGWEAPRVFDGDPVLVSFEVDIDATGSIHAPTSIDVSHNVDGDGRLVTNYESTTARCRLKSISQGFDVVHDRDALQRRLGSSRSVATGSAPDIAAALSSRIDAATACEICWTSFKTDSDGVYLSRTHPDDLVGFLDEFSYPTHLRDWVRARKDRLDHLRFDLCLDYTVEGNVVRTNRTAICGWF